MRNTKKILLNNRNKKENTITIYWATDAHVLASVDGNSNAEGAIGGTRYFYTAGQKLQKFVDDANLAKPNLVFFSGDMLEELESTTIDLFLSKWNQVNSSIQKELTVGNHDLAWTPELANTTLAESLGYGDRPIIEGSKYNQSFYLGSGDNRLKIISFDTNVNELGNHLVVTQQVLYDSIRNWVKSELLNSTTNNVVLFSHASPADDNSHFYSEHSAAFKTMIDEVIVQNPNLMIYSLAGHNHRQGIIEYPSDNPNIKYYTTSPVVDYETGKYTIITFKQKSGLIFEEKPLVYPYS